MHYSYFVGVLLFVLFIIYMIRINRQKKKTLFERKYPGNKFKKFDNEFEINSINRYNEISLAITEKYSFDLESELKNLEKLFKSDGFSEEKILKARNEYFDALKCYKNYQPKTFTIFTNLEELNKERNIIKSFNLLFRHPLYLRPYLTLTEFQEHLNNKFQSKIFNLNSNLNVLEKRIKDEQLLTTKLENIISKEEKIEWIYKNNHMFNKYFDGFDDIISTKELSSNELSVYRELIKREKLNDLSEIEKLKLDDFKNKILKFNILQGSVLGYNRISVLKIVQEINEKNNRRAISEKRPLIQNNNYLFIDTETNGLPNNYNAPASDINNWPRLVQIAFILTDENFKIIEEKDLIIKPEGFIISKESTRIHGISHQYAFESGISINEALDILQKRINKSSNIVGHNIKFDAKIISAEFIRKKIEDPLKQKRLICTMLNSTNFCKIPNKYGGYKWPTLSELYHKLFAENFLDSHNAANDIKATYKCFLELKILKVF